jgi:hypothetical protein
MRHHTCINTATIVDLSAQAPLTVVRGGARDLAKTANGLDVAIQALVISHATRSKRLAPVSPFTTREATEMSDGLSDANRGDDHTRDPIFGTCNNCGGKQCRCSAEYIAELEARWATLRRWASVPSLSHVFAKMRDIEEGINASPSVSPGRDETTERK